MVASRSGETGWRVEEWLPGLHAGRGYWIFLNLDDILYGRIFIEVFLCPIFPPFS